MAYTAPTPFAVGRPIAARRRAGVTLVELIVTLAILGLSAGLAGLAVRRADAPRRVSDVAARIAAARRAALGSARPVTITVLLDGRARAVTALPDGSVLADPSLGVDRFSGRVQGAASRDVGDVPHPR